MNKIITIAIKELQNYFYSPVGYVFAGLLMIVVYWLYFNDFFIIGQADLKPFWSVLVFLLSIFVPAISMNLLAEEKKNSTWEVILSLPIREYELVLGKFLGCTLYLLFSLLLSIPVIITVMVLGNPDLGITVGGFLGTLFLGLSYLALGLFLSTLTNQPIVAFLISSVILVLNNLISQEAITSRLPVLIRNILETLSLSWRSNNFSQGVISIQDLVFFVSWIAVFLLGSVIVLKNRGK